MSELIPSKDYLLPTGQFMEKLLGEAFLADAKMKAVTTRAKLIVLQNYYPIDEIKQQLMQDVMQGKKQMPDMNDFVPAEVNIDDELNAAVNSAENDENINGVPRLDEVLCYSVEKSILLACEQMQFGLQAMAISNSWDGNERITETSISDADTLEMRIVKDTVNKSIPTKAKHKDETQDAWDRLQCAVTLQIARIVGHRGIMDAKTILQEKGADRAISIIDKDVPIYAGVEQEYGYQEAYNMFVNDFKRTMPELSNDNDSQTRLQF